MNIENDENYTHFRKKELEHNKYNIRKYNIKDKCVNYCE